MCRFSPTSFPFHRLELTFQAIELTFHPMELKIYQHILLNRTGTTIQVIPQTGIAAAIITSATTESLK